jgi:hypothetical protein
MFGGAFGEKRLRRGDRLSRQLEDRERSSALWGQGGVTPRVRLLPSTRPTSQVADRTLGVLLFRANRLLDQANLLQRDHGRDRGREPTGSTNRNGHRR